MLSFWKKESPTNLTIFNIGSGAVSAAVITLKNNKPSVLFSARKEVVFEDSKNLESLLKKTVAALRDVAQAIARDSHDLFGKGIPLGTNSRVFCFVGSPWCDSESKTLRFEKPGMLFNKSLFDSLVGREEEKLQKSVVSRFLPFIPEEMRLIEKKTWEIKLNGYKTVEPLNKIADRAEISLFLSMAPEKVLNLFEMTIQNAFHASKQVRFQTSLFAVVSSILQNEEEFAVVDITGEVSEVAVARSGTLSEIISIPFGTSGIIKRIAKKYVASRREAFSTIKMYSEGTLSSRLSEGLSREIKDYGKDMLGTIRSLAVLPYGTKMYFIAEKEFEPLIKEWAEGSEGVRIIFINTEMYSKKISGKLPDAFIAVESVFINENYNLQ